MDIGLGRGNIEAKCNAKCLTQFHQDIWSWDDPLNLSLWGNGPGFMLLMDLGCYVEGGVAAPYSLGSYSQSVLPRVASPASPWYLLKR